MNFVLIVTFKIIHLEYCIHSHKLILAAAAKHKNRDGLRSASPNQGLILMLFPGFLRIKQTNVPLNYALAACFVVWICFELAINTIGIRYVHIW